MDVAPIREDLSETVLSLLDDIAEAKDRLAFAIGKARDQRERLQETHRRFQETVEIIHRQSAWEFPDLPLRRKPPRMHVMDRLTPREIQVLRLIAQGKSTKELASELGISFKTAVSHRSHILEKLNCHESATLVRLAMQAGLVA